MIEPCACKGDVGAVHHECLKRWLIEVTNKPSYTNFKRQRLILFILL